MPKPVVVHNLRAKGAAFSPTNLTLIDKDGGTSGIGVAVCTCGWASDVQPSGRARKAVHAEHKKQRDLIQDSDLPPDPSQFEGELESAPVDDPSEYSGPAEIVPEKDEEPVSADSPAEEESKPEIAGEDFVTILREWRGNYSISMVPFTASLAEAWGGLATRSENVSAMLRKSFITGRKDNLDLFVEYLDRHADQVFTSLKVWQKENAANRRGLTDMQKFLQNRKFIADYAEIASKASDDAQL